MSEEANELKIEWSAELGEIALALSIAQGEFEDAKKDATNPHFKTKFASLASVRAAIQPALTKNNLAVMQLFSPCGLDATCIVTLLIHKSGQWAKSVLMLPLSKKDAQGVGSAASYGRRYSLQAITGIATDDDDDANVASGKPANDAKPAQANPPVKSDVDVDALVKGLEQAADATQLSEASLKVGRVKDKLAQSDLERLRAAADNAMRRLEAA